MIKIIYPNNRDKLKNKHTPKNKIKKEYGVHVLSAQDSKNG